MESSGVVHFVLLANQLLVKRITCGDGFNWRLCRPGSIIENISPIFESQAKLADWCADNVSVIPKPNLKADAITWLQLIENKLDLEISLRP